MAPQSLAELIELLRQCDELVNIDVALDPCLEVSAFADRVCKGALGGRALRFGRVGDSPFAVLMNLFGSASRMALALGLGSLGELGQRLHRDLESLSAHPADTAIRRLLEDASYAPRVEARAPWMDRTLPDFSSLPALTAWPGDGGAYLTLAQMHSRDPISGTYNCGLYRMQILGPRKGAIRLHPGSGLGAHLAAGAEAGHRELPLAIVLGGPPTMLLAACTSLPQSTDEQRFAAWVQKHPLTLTPSPIFGIPVSSEADFVLEGVLATGEQVPEGPFGNHSGFYQPQHRAPCFHLKGIRHRSDALYPATLVGRPPMENLWLGRAQEQISLVRLRIDYPQIQDLHMPQGGIYHRCALLRVSEGGTHGDRRELLDALMRQGPLQGGRLVILVDEDIDLRNSDEVFWAAINRGFDAKRWVRRGSSLGVDAGFGGHSLDRVLPDAQVEERVRKLLADFERQN